MDDDEREEKKEKEKEEAEAEVDPFSIRSPSRSRSLSPFTRFADLFSTSATIYSKNLYGRLLYREYPIEHRRPSIPAGTDSTRRDATSPNDERFIVFQNTTRVEKISADIASSILENLGTLVLVENVPFSLKISYFNQLHILTCRSSRYTK